MRLIVRLYHTILTSVWILRRTTGRKTKCSAVEHNFHPDTSLRSFLVLCAWKRLLRLTLKTPSELRRSPRTPQATQNSQPSHSHHALKHSTARVSTNLSTYKHTQTLTLISTQLHSRVPQLVLEAPTCVFCLSKRDFCEFCMKAKWTVHQFPLLLIIHLTKIKMFIYNP